MIDITFDPRMAGQIRRYHTWPVTHQQTNGEHSWQIARIMLSVWPDVPRKLLVHCQFHDVGEMAGDIPYPFKKNDPVLKNRMDAAEQGVHKEMSRQHGIPYSVTLSEYEAAFFKCCEYLEMWEFGLNEVNRGNQYGVLISERCILGASKLLENMKILDRMSYPDVTPTINRYVRNRMTQESPNAR